MENIDGKFEKIKIPEVKFGLLTMQEQADVIFHFCFEKSSGGFDWSEYIYKHHPKLKEMVSGIEDTNQLKEKCYEYVEDYKTKNESFLYETREKFQKSWDIIGQELFKGLSDDFETGLPEEIKEIKARVSINPICPRYLNKWSFDVFNKSTDIEMKKTCIHEIIHFLYFKKWLEVFPNYDKKKFDGPNSEWKLSEILVASIINNNKTTQSILNNFKTDTYNEWRAIKIGEKTLVEYFGDIYKKHIEGEISFADFLKKSWEEYKKHKDIIEGK